MERGQYAPGKYEKEAILRRRNELFRDRQEFGLSPAEGAELDVLVARYGEPTPGDIASEEENHWKRKAREITVGLPVLQALLKARGAG